jgi:hypothetical protein
MSVPLHPKIYHIVHADRLSSITHDGCLWCDAEITHRFSPGTTIGMNSIKERRLNDLTLESHPGLFVGQCVPFYFCPRSVMLYLLYRRDHPDLTYRDGQETIIHLEADFHAAVDWADQNRKRWAFTLSNAGSKYFEDRKSLSQLHEINWSAIGARQWSGPGVDPSVKEGKQAEFLIEYCFPWHLVERIGVYSHKISQHVLDTLQSITHKPRLEIRRDWYY